MPETLTLFVIVAAAAIVLQFFVLLALALAARKSLKRLDTLAGELERRGLPTLEAAHTFLMENSPKVSAILDNAADGTTRIKNQIVRVDSTLHDVIDRTRLQVIRADELVTRTLDHVEEATELVHHRVLSPLRRVAGLVQGVSAGIGALVGYMAGGRNGSRKSDTHLFI